MIYLPWYDTFALGLVVITLVVVAVKKYRDGS